MPKRRNSQVQQEAKPADAIPPTQPKKQDVKQNANPVALPKSLQQWLPKAPAASAGAAPAPAPAAAVPAHQEKPLKETRPVQEQRSVPHQQKQRSVEKKPSVDKSQSQQGQPQQAKPQQNVEMDNNASTAMDVDQSGEVKKKKKKRKPNKPRAEVGGADPDDNVEVKSQAHIQSKIEAPKAEKPKFERPKLEKQKSKVPLQEEDQAIAMNNLTITKSSKEAIFSTELFSSMKIAPAILSVITNNVGFTVMTKIQALSMPPLLAGFDVIGQAKTGSGKTLAFLIPAIERMLQDPSARCLVLVPTRELGIQTMTEARPFLEKLKVSSLLVMGGTDIEKQRKGMSSDPRIVVAAPGRLTEHLDEFRRWFSAVKIVVFDEADRLLDMGFRPQIRKIQSYLPNKANRQTALFSATINKDVTLCGDLKADFKHVSAVSENEANVNASCQQEYIKINTGDLIPALVALLKEHREEKIMVFFQTVWMTKFIYDVLLQEFPNAKALHSKMTQNARTKVFTGFKGNAGAAILCSTNVAARGLDVPDVDLILQVGAPDDLETYIHRIGRTGRAGRSGHAIALLRNFELKLIVDLSKQGIKPVEIDLPNNMVSLKLPLNSPEAMRALETTVGFICSRSKDDELLAEIREMQRAFNITQKYVPHPKVLLSNYVLEKLQVTKADRKEFLAKLNNNNKGGQGRQR